MKAPRVAGALAAVIVLAVLVSAVGAAADDGDLGALGHKRTVVTEFVKQKGKGKKKGVTSFFECQATLGGGSQLLDCDDPYPNNEPQIAVDPTDPQHLIASSNDYGSCCDEYYTSVDGGQTWATGNMSTEKATSQGPIGSDPVTAFDAKHGVALHASLNFYLSKDFAEACNGDVVVSASRDGGLSWDPPAVVAQGRGCDLDKEQLFNDKEWIVVDNNPSSKYYGRAYVTWTGFLARRGAYQSSPIYASFSDDGGRHWSDAQVISGRSKSLCSFQTTGKRDDCDEDQFSVPTVGPDGTVYVAFENSQNQGLWEAGDQFESQYLVVRSTDGGKKWSDPFFVAGLEDGIADYPLNADGQQTLSGYQVRVNSAGNIVAAPNGTLYLTFSDNRNGTAAETNVDVFVTTSSNGGATWSDPVAADERHGDQWFPWVDVNPVTGEIGIVYNDRGATNGPAYGVTLAEGASGGPFATTPINAAPSNPVLSAFFRAEDPDPTCEECAVFHGDYIGLAYGSDGYANTAWTDMSEQLGDGLYAQFIGFARA